MNAVDKDKLTALRPQLKSMYVRNVDSERCRCECCCRKEGSVLPRQLKRTSDVVKVLLQNGAEMKFVGTEIRTSRAAEGDTEVVKVLIQMVPT